jgi:hypothetical protein
MQGSESSFPAARYEASRALFLLFVVHPLSVAAFGSPRGRGSNAPLECCELKFELVINLKTAKALEDMLTVAARNKQTAELRRTNVAGQDEENALLDVGKPCRTLPASRPSSWAARAEGGGIDPIPTMISGSTIEGPNHSTPPPWTSRRLS